jgi:hypothetical protein
MKIARGRNPADVVERWLSYSSHFSTPDGYLSACPWPVSGYGSDRLRAGAQCIVPVDRRRPGHSDPGPLLPVPEPGGGDPAARSRFGRGKGATEQSKQPSATHPARRQLGDRRPPVAYADRLARLDVLVATRCHSDRVTATVTSERCWALPH